MKTIFVNLKRFDVPQYLGGVCPLDDGEEWARNIINESIELGLQNYENIRIVYFFPESHLISATKTLQQYESDLDGKITIGCQGVHRENVNVGGNFGAFTTFFPAASAVAIGCEWALIGHSEERNYYNNLFSELDASLPERKDIMALANQKIHQVANKEALRAFESGMKVLFCMGETQKERGDGPYEMQKKRLVQVFREQVEIGLKNVNEFANFRELVIGYEPRWAIGPGKIPPGPDYIDFAAKTIKSAAKDYYGIDAQVVYGGGLKVENAKSVAEIPSIDGGLVALTQFTGNIGFSPEGLKSIIESYCEGV